MNGEVEQGGIKSAKPNVRTAFHCFGQNEPNLRANAAVTASSKKNHTCPP